MLKLLEFIAEDDSSNFIQEILGKICQEDPRSTSGPMLMSFGFPIQYLGTFYRFLKNSRHFPKVLNLNW